MYLNDLILCVIILNFVVSFALGQVVIPELAPAYRNFVTKTRELSADTGLLTGTRTAAGTKSYCMPYQFTEPKQSDCQQLANTLSRSQAQPDKKTNEILEEWGNTVKTYKVTTKDDYILTVFRVLDSDTWDEKMKYKNKTPVYMNHGLACSSDIWFFQPKGRNIATMLIHEGFDVWFPNTRGTSYSLEHKTLDYDSDLSYWDFSQHELGLYDVPAVTDLILEKTGYKKILMIGYSMGSTTSFIGLAELPELNQKIQATFHMAPTAYQGHNYNSARMLARVLHSYEAWQAINARTKGRLSSSAQLKQQLGINSEDMCMPDAAKCGMCDNVWFWFFGFNANQMNYTQLPTILKRFPNIIGTKCLSLYGQHIHYCRFNQYNYGTKINLLKYGSTDPPEYKLENIQSPQYFYVAPRDNLGTPMDANITANKLRPGVLKRHYTVPDEYFTHMDFAIAKDADTLVYKEMINDMKRYKK